MVWLDGVILSSPRLTLWAKSNRVPFFSMTVHRAPNTVSKCQLDTSTFMSKGHLDVFIFVLVRLIPGGRGIVEEKNKKKPKT